MRIVFFLVLILIRDLRALSLGGQFFGYLWLHDILNCIIDRSRQFKKNNGISYISWSNFVLAETKQEILRYLLGNLFKWYERYIAIEKK